MDLQDLLFTALRTSLIYFVLLLIVRVLGKREVGNTSAFDLIVALMLGEVVDEIIFGDVSLVKGLLALGVVAIWHIINSWATSRSQIVQKLTSAQPTILIENGKVKDDALAKERMHPDEVFAEMRLLGIDNIKEVKLATLEPNGQISVLQEDWAKPVQKQDVFTEMAQAAENTSKAAKKDIADKNKKIQHPEETTQRR